jgi:SAM-dependent methyltransferase
MKRENLDFLTKKTNQGRQAVAVAEPPREGCPACGGAAFEPLFTAGDRLYHTTDEKFLIVQCSKCRLLRLQPRPRSTGRPAAVPVWPQGDTLADRIERAYRRFVMADDVRFVLSVLARTEASGPILDLSPDNEPFRRALAPFCPEVIAAQPDAERPPVAPGSCAAITMLHVLEKLEDPSAFLDAARDLLQPDGRLIVRSPNAACWQFLMFGERWSRLDVPRRPVLFRSRDLELLLECCGFEILRRKHFSWRSNPADFSTSVAPGLDPIARRARGVRNGPFLSTVKHLLFLALTASAVPLTVIEAACRAGSTITIEARRKW